MREDGRSLHHRRVVVQRLALSLKQRACDDARRLVAPRHPLRDDFPRLEIANQSKPAGGAEGTSHRAAGLAGNADGELALYLQRNPNRLGQRTIVKAKEVL